MEGLMKRITVLLLFLLILPSFLFAKIPNDPLYDEQWYLETIDAPLAWDAQTGSREVVVAVLDTGLDLDHPDLVDNLWENSDEIAGNGIDDDGNGFIDDVNGWDFVDDDNDPVPDIGLSSDADAVTHGTVIAGIAGAVGDNGIGTVGVAWNVKLMSVRMLDDVGTGDSFTAADAIDYAVANGADIVNLSFAGELQDPIMRTSVRDAYRSGTVIISALGNENQNTDINPVFPACFLNSEEDWVIGVGASTEGDHKADFSNYGEDCVDISAPGEGIFGLNYQNSTEGFDLYYDGYWSGTSMAAPIVSGAAALLLAHYPDLVPEEVSSILKLSVDPMDTVDFFKGKVGAGRINVARAIEYGAQFSSPEEIETFDEVEAAVQISSPSFSTVYHVEDDSKRRAYINDTTYFTWHDSFDVVTEVEDSYLPTLSLSGLMLPKPGIVLVKIQSDPTVYALEENPDDAFSPLLRAISSEEIAIEMYGEMWADFVIDVEPTFFSNFTDGFEITSAFEVDTSIMKTRQQLSDLSQ